MDDAQLTAIRDRISSGITYHEDSLALLREVDRLRREKALAEAKPARNKSGDAKPKSKPAKRTK